MQDLMLKDNFFSKTISFHLQTLTKSHHTGKIHEHCNLKFFLAVGVIFYIRGV
jgi:hypothetical protein